MQLQTKTKLIYLVLCLAITLGNFCPVALAEENTLTSSIGLSSKNQEYIDAVEIKLKAREIADQLLATYPNDLLRGLVALPTSFVNLDDLHSSSSLGRYLAEAMFYEFNLRGFATKEYRLNGLINTVSGAGEFALTRDIAPTKYNQSYDALLIGTYTKDEAAMFINVRLIRPVDGLVLRVAQIVIPTNEVIDRMSKEKPLRTGNLKITKK